MVWLVMIALLVLSSSYAFAEIIRFSGSNKNTIHNSLEVLPYDPPEFGENITLRANITDDQDGVFYVNFTLQDPDGNHPINNENGTVFGDYWNSSSVYRLNQTGVYYYSVQSVDNDTTNRTVALTNLSFTITDNLYQNPDEIIATMPINYDANYTINLWTDTRELLNFTISHTIDANFTVSQLPQYLMINSTEYSTYQINISSNASSSAGLHQYYINITRHTPFNRSFLFPINITISSNYGDVEFIDSSDYTFTSCPGSISHSLEATNLGNFEMTDCYPFLYLADATEVSTATRFTLSAGSNASAIVTYSYGGGTVETWFGVECTASPGGSKDRTSIEPKITFVEATGCGDTGTGGGGGGISVSPRREFEPEPEPEFKKTQCGDLVCEGEENPFNCQKDCVPDLLNLQNIFCQPIFNCGNWKTAWFTNLSLMIVIGGVVFFYFRSRQVGRLR